jgi:hypothetical protein
VSLCFSKPSTLRFNVWMDWENSQSNISPTLTVHVEWRGRVTELPSTPPRKSSQPPSGETPRLGVDSFAPRVPVPRPYPLGSQVLVPVNERLKQEGCESAILRTRWFVCR